MYEMSLKDKLIDSLGKIYYMEAFSQLIEFLQGELYILYFLSNNKNTEVYPSMLSEELHISRPRITAALNTLRKKGYVDTIASEEDRRKVRVLITYDGLSFIREKQENVENLFEIIVKELGEENTLELIRLIDLSVDIMKRHNV
jgi:DNA-binding MarR family transcriptional regulator